MKNYLDLMKRILDEGDIKNPARENMPRTKELFAQTLVFDLQQGFPLLTTKKMFLRGVIEELLWFLSGSTDIGDLIRENVHIWDEDGYRFYRYRFELQKAEEMANGVPEAEFDKPFTFEEWVKLADGNGCIYNIHAAGKNYSYLWRRWDGNIDQVVKLLNTIIKSPDSRYQIVTAWNPTVVAENDVALPSCHLLWQTSVRQGKYLDLAIYQRSCDYALGVPFNVASYALLTYLLSEITCLHPGVLTWIGGSVHLYENQVDSALIQLEREPMEMPTLYFCYTDEQAKAVSDCYKSGWTSDRFTAFIKSLDKDNFDLKYYKSHPKLDFPFSSGLKKEDIKQVW